MRKIWFTEYQNIAVLKSVETGWNVKVVCREAAISENSYYNWRAKHGRMEAVYFKMVKDVEDENCCLKQMFVDLRLECRAQKEVIRKALKLVIKRELVSYLTAQFTISIRQACRTLSLRSLQSTGYVMWWNGDPEHYWGNWMLSSLRI